MVAVGNNPHFRLCLLNCAFCFHYPSCFLLAQFSTSFEGSRKSFSLWQCFFVSKGQAHVRMREKGKIFQRHKLFPDCSGFPAILPLFAFCVLRLLIFLESELTSHDLVWGLLRVTNWISFLDMYVYVHC